MLDDAAALTEGNVIMPHFKGLLQAEVTVVFSIRLV